MILKIIAVIAMVLAIAHAAMPAFGQKPNNSAGNRYAHNNNGDKGKSPSHAPTISETKETAGPAPKSDSDSQPDKLDQDSINIRNPTPMSKPWGWREWIPWSGNLLLVLVGIVGVVVAVVTLAAIKRQAKIMETQARHMADQLAEIKRQADVMEEQIQATKSRERARLVGTPTVFEYFDADNLPFGQFLELEVENVGYSHAFDVSIEGRCEVK